MNNEDRLIRALNELSEVAERNRQKQEEDRKCEAEVRIPAIAVHQFR